MSKTSPRSPHSGESEAAATGEKHLQLGTTPLRCAWPLSGICLSTGMIAWGVKFKDLAEEVGVCW